MALILHHLSLIPIHFMQTKITCEKATCVYCHLISYACDYSSPASFTIPRAPPNEFQLQDSLLSENFYQLSRIFFGISLYSRVQSMHLTPKRGEFYPFSLKIFFLWLKLLSPAFPVLFSLGLNMLFLERDLSALLKLLSIVEFKGCDIEISNIFFLLKFFPDKPIDQ